jgi:TonB-dependent starch-binding outer membrane protein SusC
MKKILLIVQIAVILLILGIPQARANVAFSQKTRLSFKLSESKYIMAFGKTESESVFFISNNEKHPDIDHKVSISIQDQFNDLILNRSFSGAVAKNNSINHKNDLAGVDLEELQQAQPLKVSGTVTDATSGESLVGVNIYIEGTTIGVVSDINGKFSIEAPAKNAVLIVSYIGYISAKIVYTGQTTIDIKLARSVQSLEAVVVIGYGSAKRKDLTGSVALVDASKINGQTVQNVTQTLQ